MSRGLASGIFLTLVVLLPNSAAISSPMVVFDFDAIQSLSKKAATAAGVQAYMEELFGADILVSQKTAAVNSSLMIGKGKGAPAISLDFGDNRINSFAVDYQLFKRAKSFTILADGDVVTLQTPSKSERKAGLSGQQTAIFFDNPVQTLQFIGKNKKSFAIDNLIINIPLTDDGAQLNDSDIYHGDISTDPADLQSTNSTRSLIDGNLASVATPLGVSQAIAAVPEASSLPLLIIGLIAIAGRRHTREACLDADPGKICV